MGKEIIGAAANQDLAMPTFNPTQLHFVSELLVLILIIQRTLYENIPLIVVAASGRDLRAFGRYRIELRRSNLEGNVRQSVDYHRQLEWRRHSGIGGSRYLQRQRDGQF